MNSITTFFNNNKVFILGLLAAIAVVLQQFLLEPTIDWKSVGLGVLLGILSYVANQWRGQGVTILGIIGTLAYTFVQNFNGGVMDWNKIILMGITAILAAVAPPPKSINYEKSATIVAAKDQAAGITASEGKTSNISQ